MGGHESVNDLLEYLGPIEDEPEPEHTITPDDVGGIVGQQLIRGLVLQVAEMIDERERTAEPEPASEQIAS